MANQPPMQATDTFVATMSDGSDHLVTKGQVLPFGHELVRRDREGSGTLFRPLDLGGEDEPEPKSDPAKTAPPPEPVKAPAAKGTPKAAGKAP
jgi:hypothetical protein